MRIFSKLFPNNRNKRSGAFDPMDDPALSAPPPSVRTKDIIGSEDSRKPVDASDMPLFSGIGLLYSYNDRNANANLSGTGWLIDRNTVVTAAHNLFNKDAFLKKNGYQPSAVKIWLGQNGPAQSFANVRYAAKWFVHDAYLKNRSKLEYDVAVIKLDRPADAASEPFRIIDLERENGFADIGVVGYPSDIQHPPLKMYYAYGGIVSVESGRLFHNVDTAKGQSGGPILTPHDGGLCVIGIHTQGKDFARTRRLKANMGVVLNASLQNWISSRR